MKLQHFLSIYFILTTALYSDSFTTQGADLLMGVGAKNIATAGAKTANIDDIYSIFYNPAGLAQIKSGEIAISSQLDAELGYISFLGLAYAMPIESLNLKVAIAFAYIPRLYISASGTYREEDFESIFLRYTLPGLSPNFSGEVESTTNDYRFAIAFSQLYNPSWSLGFSVGYINCATTFAGVYTRGSNELHICVYCC